MVPNLVQPVPYTNATASLNVIIPEVLKEDNYKRWSILMRHYFVAQGLWDVVLSSQIPWSEDPGDWTKKNALALLAIKMSCGAETFDQIEKMDSARDAWNALADLHKPPNVDGQRGSETDAAGLISSANRIQPGMLLGNYQRPDEFVSLLKDIYAGDWNALKSLDRITEIIFPNGLTVLHMATIARVCIPKGAHPSEATDRSRKKICGRYGILHAAWIQVMGAILPIPIVAGRPVKLYNLKLTHTFANSVLQYWCKEISTYRDARQLDESGTISAIFQAIKNGRVKIVIEILKSNPDLIWCNKNLSREILISAIKHRQGGILGFVLRLDAGKKTFLSLTDEDGNNVLHLVAKLSDHRAYVSLDPTWAAQREGKWFQVVS
ncbi:hypothetical protein SLEP1_g55561 [Rubroshorea leprosula]|uniref:DUF4219 domain-containing protein n=1 Tax=Rubroshorea leprosula TaxID=152421 RepID=A0AAV5MGX3_9ROSI|nr:hypothetical protein SLEP1_g55561 [Rubroshorea leprosula]